MPFSYANPTSGPSAGGIGWFNFGNLSMNPGDSVTGLTGTLSDGSIVTFDMSLALISGTPRQFNASPVPTYPLAQFGTAGYTGLAGNVAMYAGLLDGTTAISAFTISNITVRDALNNPVPNYTMLIGDAESTNEDEAIQGLTDGGDWSLFTTVGSGSIPTLTGVGTQTFNYAGVMRFGPVVSYVMATQMPKQVVITLYDLDPVQTRQGFVIGFAVTRLSLQKNIGQRIDPTDQFLLDIAGNPADQATTTGSATGIQTEIASVYATPGNTYTISESMAPGSASVLTDYTKTVSSANATPAGSVPPVGSLPIAFTPALGDNVTYTILNAAPEVFKKTVDKAYADVGEVLTYTVVVDNPNNFAVNNVLVTDQTPAGTTYIGNLSVSAPYTGTDPASSITITTIGPASSVTITYQVQTNTVPPMPNPIPNYANVTVPGGTSGMTNVVTTQVNTAYVTIIKTVDKEFASTGEILTYTLTLNNAGNVPATNVNITDAIPAGTAFVPGSVTGATGTPPNLTLIGSLPAGGTRTVTFQVKVGESIPDPNPIPNSASSAYRYTVDPTNPDGSSGTAQSNLVNTLVNSAIVTTTKSVDKAFAALGEVLTYTLTLKNTGNTAANNVAITDIVPAGTTFIPGSVTGATGTPPNLTLANPIPAGGSAVITFQVLIGNEFPPVNPIPNSASATFTYTVDPQFPDGVDGSSNSNIVTTQVRDAVVTVLKTVDKAFADTGEVLTYTLKLTNSGNTSADQVVITDLIPSGTTFLNGSLTGASGMPPLFALANPIAPGDSVTVTFQVQIGDTIPVPNPIPNNATAAFLYTVNPEIPDGAAGNAVSNTVTTLVNTANVSTVKAVDKAYAQPGDILTYTLTLNNTGNVPAYKVRITDAVPAGTTYVPGSLTGADGAPPVLTLKNPIGAGESAVVTFQVKVGAIPVINPIPNRAAITYVYTIDPSKPNGGNGGGNSNEVVTQINTAVLKVLKSVDKNIAYPGDIVTYKFAVTNSGNIAAEHVVLTDLLPNGLVYVPGSLTASVLITGTPPAIQITAPIAAGQTVNISFRAKIVTMPNPNPAINQGTVTYDYPVDPNEPNVPGTSISNRVCTRVFRNNYLQQITDIIESAAMEEAALSALINGEGAKIQKMAADNHISPQELMCLNRSLNSTMDSISLLEAVIQQKIAVIDCQINKSCQ